MTHARALVVALFCLFLSFGSADAGHQAVLGKKIILKDPDPAGDAARRQWGVQVKETESDATLVGDPTTNGATVSVFTEGTSSSSESYSLPQGLSSKGKPLWRATASGFVYSDPDGVNGPVRGLRILRSSSGTFQLSVKASGKTGAIGVVPPNSGSRACVRVDLGGGDSYHALFGVDATIGKNDEQQFQSEAPASAGLCCDLETSPPCCPASCPGDACHFDGSCDAIDGLCQNEPRPDGSTCDAGLGNLEPMTCNSGNCETCTPSGNCACTVDTECPSGQICTGGQCTCTSDTQCASGQTCAAGSCTCTGNADCAAGQECTDGLCATPARACAFDAQCTQGHCILSSSPSPRFVDNEDGTVTDRQTCLVWEKKDAYDGIAAECPDSGGAMAASCANPHDADNRYTAGFSGSARTSFIAALNAASFAGHSTWRMPGAELQGLVDPAAPGCGAGAPCTDSAFDDNCVPTCSGTDPTCSCTAPHGYWFGNAVSLVDFLDGSTTTGVAGVGQGARAVRGCVALTTDIVTPVKAQCFNQCAIGCGVDGDCIYGCMLGQDFSSDTCNISCDGFAPTCLQSCLQTIECISYLGPIGACTPP